MIQNTDIVQLSINTIRTLAMDAVQTANSGHPGTPMAGYLKLSNLCWIYDNNQITIEGHTDWAFSEDVATRFLGYGWNVLRVGDRKLDTPEVQ